METKTAADLEAAARIELLIFNKTLREPTHRLAGSGSRMVACAITEPPYRVSVEDLPDLAANLCCDVILAE